MGWVHMGTWVLLGHLSPSNPGCMGFLGLVRVCESRAASSEMGVPPSSWGRSAVSGTSGAMEGYPGLVFRGSGGGRAGPVEGVLLAEVRVPHSVGLGWWVEGAFWVLECLSPPSGVFLQVEANGVHTAS